MVINGNRTTMNQSIIRNIAEEHHGDMVSLGWSDTSKSDEHYLMLTIGEIGEAMQSHRRGMVDFRRKVGKEFIHEYIDDKELPDALFIEAFEFYIKDSVADEMADALLRVLDHIKMRGLDYLLDLEESPLTNRKYTGVFSEVGYSFSSLVTQETDIATRLWKAMWFIIKWSESLDLDIELSCMRKMRYNRLRSDWKNKEKSY